LRGNDLAPLWMFPNDAVLQKAAELLFTQADSPLSPAQKFGLVHTPLLTVPAYRLSVLSALDDAAIMGTATRSPERLLSFRLMNGDGGGSVEPAHDPRQVPPGQTRPVRVKDLVAAELTAFEGAPKFELDWPESEKDQAAAGITAFLKAHADELR